MKWITRFGIAFFLIACNTLAGSPPETPARGKAGHVVLIVWDGMRPDFVTAQYTPALYQLMRAGVAFQNNHAVYVTSTEVNGTALATGVYPNRSHIIANREYRPDINPLNPIATESIDTIRKGDTLGKYLGAATLEETLQRAGHPTVVAGTKSVALLADRSDQRAPGAAQNSTIIFSGKSIPPSAIENAGQTLGAKFPAEVQFPNAGEDTWTTRVLTEFLWKDEVPAFSLLWLSDPDFSQHNTAPGSPVALAALKSDDDNLARVLAALDAKGVRDNTDVIVVSDHGFSTIEKGVDVVAELTKAGFTAAPAFKETPKPGEIMVVGVGGSVLLYVTGHEPVVTQKLVDFLQQSDFAGVIFTRDKMDGTFPLSAARIDSPSAPDVLVSLRWSGHANKYGVPGSITAASGARSQGRGMHASLSSFDVHNTLIASGPDFKRGAEDNLPTGNIDVAPTILWILGVAPLEPLDGRVLFEAMTPGEAIKSGTKPITLTRERNEGKIHWRQYLKYTRYAGRLYLDAGNGGEP